MTGLELASHIALAEAFFLRGVINGAFEWKQLELKTPAEVLAYYDENVPPLLAQVASLPATNGSIRYSSVLAALRTATRSCLALTNISP